VIGKKRARRKRRAAVLIQLGFETPECQLPAQTLGDGNSRPRRRSDAIRQSCPDDYQTYCRTVPSGGPAALSGRRFGHPDRPASRATLIGSGGALQADLAMRGHAAIPLHYEKLVAQPRPA
jgi:hypothetical protein